MSDARGEYKRKKAMGEVSKREEGVINHASVSLPASFEFALASVSR